MISEAGRIGVMSLTVGILLLGHKLPAFEIMLGRGPIFTLRSVWHPLMPARTDVGTRESPVCWRPSAVRWRCAQYSFGIEGAESFMLCQTAFQILLGIRLA